MSEFSNFIRNASPKEKEEVFSRVIDMACNDQDMIRKAAEESVIKQKEMLDRFADHDSGKKAINTSKVKSMIDLK